MKRENAWKFVIGFMIFCLCVVSCTSTSTLTQAQTQQPPPRFQTVAWQKLGDYTSLRVLRDTQTKSEYFITESSWQTSTFGPLDNTSMLTALVEQLKESNKHAAAIEAAFQEQLKLNKKISQQLEKVR